MASREVSQFEEQGACGTPPQAPTLCINNCGFFGTPQNNFLCSSCYKKSLKASSPASSLSNCQDVARREPNSPSSAYGQPPSPSAEPPLTCDTEPYPALPSSSCAMPPKKPNRCFSCHKRVGLTGFKCRCGDVFCSSHRHSDQHDCSFDYKALARDNISKANPVVKADKLNRI